MQIDVDWIRDHFDLYNEKYFGGELPRPMFSVCNARSRLGSLSFKWKTISSGPKSNHVRRVPYNHCIRLSVYYDIPECDYQNTLLHEMIHYYISVKQLKDTSVHGVLFHKWMDSLNSKGWNINVSEKSTLPIAHRNKGQWRIVLAVVTKKAEYFFCVIHPHYVPSISQRVRQIPLLSGYAWYVTNDIFFMSFPKSRSLRGRTVTKECFEEKTKSMEPLVF